MLIDVASGLTRYHLDQGSFPEEQPDALKVLFADPGLSGWKGPYIEDHTYPLKDPWGNDFIYRVFTEDGDTVAAIYAIGENGKFEEGEGDDLGILVPAPKKDHP